ncbi:MAG: hypothetical protein HFG28_12815 [Eubacterium sp.]|nr:hypothetical protein [Eubacterium sp.]
MDLQQRKIRQQNRDLAIKLIIPVAILAKIIYIYFLPPRYFFDSWRMVAMLTDNGSMGAWTGYQDTVDFHTKINIFNLTDVNQFSIFYGIIMTPLILFMVSKVQEMEMKEVLFTLMATGVLNIYVFNINKEMIQILYFLAIYIVISLPIKNTLIKILGCAGVFYYESLSFRSYYILMAVMSIFLYVIFLWLRKRRKITKFIIIFTVFLCFAGIFAFFYASKFVAYDDYMDALNVRDGITSTVKDAGGGANSAIYNPITVNGNLGNFMIDYVINSVRMMFPIELLVKSPGYAPFFFYQIFILYYLFRTLKNIRDIDNKMVVVLSCFVAYFFGSVVFEPDFGSWVRHEATTFPIMQLLAFHSVSYKENRVITELKYETEII